MAAEKGELLAVADQLLAGQSLKVISLEVVQTLWQGYGYVCRVQTTNDSQVKQSLILKYVKPPQSSNAESEGHLRKVFSYEVEQYFYAQFAPLLPPVIPVAHCYASINSESKVALLLQDLRERFPVAGEKRATLNEVQVHVAIKWLAKFHGFWQTRTATLKGHGLRLPPLQEVHKMNVSRPGSARGVWLNGGYTYLSTRRTEFDALCQDVTSEWSTALCVSGANSQQSIAEQVAQVLAPSTDTKRSTLGDHETLIHGDVKSENLFTSRSGDVVAFFDFQYVGLGCGLSDLAKLFTCSVPNAMLHEAVEASQDALNMSRGESALLEYYRRTVEEVTSRPYPLDIFIMHWQTALIDWLRFQASWGFWGNTSWLEARARFILKDQVWLDWLSRASSI